MRKLISLCGTAVVVLALLGTTSATAQTPAASMSNTPSAWVKSLKITTEAVPDTDESRLLGLSMWHFTITAPKPVHRVVCILEAQKAGKPSSELERISLEPNSGWPTDQRLSVFVGQYPLYVYGKGFEAVCKYQVRIDDFVSSPAVMRGTNTSSAVAEYPLSEMSTSASGSPEQRPDGSVVLISGYKHGTKRTENIPPDAAIVFRVQEEAN